MVYDTDLTDKAVLINYHSWDDYHINYHGWDGHHLKVDKNLV